MTLDELRNYRIDSGLTKVAVARAAGVSHAAYSRFEDGIKHQASPATIERYAAAIELAVKSNPTKPMRAPSRVPDENHYEIAHSNVASPTFAYDPVRPRTGRDLRQFYEIYRSNPHVKQVIDLITNVAFWVPASVKPDPSNDYTKYPGHEQRDNILIDLVTRMFKGFSEHGPSFRDVLRAWFKSGPISGMAVGAPVWSCRTPYWWLDTIKQKPSWDFTPVVDEWGNLIGLWHYPSASPLRDRAQYGHDVLNGYHPDRFFYAPWPGLENENYLGVSEIEAIQTEIQSVNVNRKSLQRYIKKRALPPVQHIREDRSAKVLDPLIAQLESMDVLNVPGRVNDKGELIPSSVIKGLDAPVQDRLVDSLVKMIEEDTKTIGRSMGKPDLLGTTNTSAGSYALGRVQFDSFLAVGDNATSWIDYNVTRLIRQIVRFNFPDWLKDPTYCPPVYAHDALDEEVQARISKRLQDEVKARILLPEEAREKLGYGPWPTADTPQDEEIES